jgi:hypothetical protein
MPAAHPLWTDYVAAFGTVVGIAIAGSAFVVARRSARDSTRSAESAERTARAAESIGAASAATLEAATKQLELATAEPNDSRRNALGARTSNESSYPRSVAGRVRKHHPEFSELVSQTAVTVSSRLRSSPSYSTQDRVRSYATGGATPTRIRSGTKPTSVGRALMACRERSTSS